MQEWNYARYFTIKYFKHYSIVCLTTITELLCFKKLLSLNVSGKMTLIWKSEGKWYFTGLLDYLNVN